jgi:hypothetical protein
VRGQTESLSCVSVDIGSERTPSAKNDRKTSRLSPISVPDFQTTRKDGEWGTRPKILEQL